MFRITSGKGFQLVFANGWTVSVQFGPGNYCDNRNMGFTLEQDRFAGEQGSTTAEIAAWDAEGKWYDFGADTVKGYCSPDEVAEFIAKVVAFPSATAKTEEVLEFDHEVVELNQTQVNSLLGLE